MTQEEILEGNKLIAEFMGGILRTATNEHPNNPYNKPTWWGVGTRLNIGHFELQYHSSWDWLMPVVEKIRDMKNESAEYMTQNSKVASALTTVRIWIVYKAVIEFIKWHNTQTK